MKRLRLHIALLSIFVFFFTGSTVSFLQAFEGDVPSQARHAFSLYEKPLLHFESGIIRGHLEPRLFPLPELNITSDLFDISKFHKAKADAPHPTFVDSSLPESIASDEDETALQNVLNYSTCHRYYSQTRDFPSEIQAKRIACCPMESGVAIGAP